MRISLLSWLPLYPFYYNLLLMPYENGPAVSYFGHSLKPEAASFPLYEHTVLEVATSLTAGRAKDRMA